MPISGRGGRWEDGRGVGGARVGGLGRAMVDVVFTSEFLLQCLKG